MGQPCCCYCQQELFLSACDFPACWEELLNWTEAQSLAAGTSTTAPMPRGATARAGQTSPSRTTAARTTPRWARWPTRSGSTCTPTACGGCWHTLPGGMPSSDPLLCCDTIKCRPTSCLYVHLDGKGGNALWRMLHFRENESAHGCRALQVLRLKSRTSSMQMPDIAYRNVHHHMG